MQSVSSFMETECLSDVSSEEVVRRLRERQREAAQAFGRLTLRERQVLQMVTRGLPNKAVACQLSLSVKTVEKHRGSIMRKLGLKSVCELLYLWYSLTWDRTLEAG